MNPQPIYVCGATASGKSAHAIELAKRVGGEVVNGDAFQLYRGIEVLSAAPDETEKAHLPHHLYGVLDPSDSCDAMRYAEMAAAMINEIASRGKVPVVVGGSGLYLKFLTHGASPLPKGNKELRASLDPKTLDELLAELEELDPIEAAQVDRANRRFVSRSLEICLLSGKKVSEMRDGWAEKTMAIESSLQGIWLMRERAELHQRIAARTRRMLECGAIEEVAALADTPGNWAKAIGVEEIRMLLAGKITRDECEVLVIQATRQYAKRQETWFRREKWLEIIGA